MQTTVQPYTVPSASTDGPNAFAGTGWQNKDFKQYYGYYKTIPELRAAVNSLANWSVGRGYECDEGTRTRLGRITGMGEDTFKSLMWNMIVVKKINGDAYAEIIRNPDNGDIVNIKPLSPETMTTVVDSSGRITGYTQMMTDNKSPPRELKVTQVLHLMNERFADNIHGTSIIEACKWVIDARNEAMSDWRRISHRSTIRVLYVEMDNTTKINAVKSQYAEAINKGELLVLPAKKGDAEFGELTLPPIDAFLSWIQYLENFFYIALNVPKAALGGSSSATEASAKVDIVTYDQAWNTEQQDLEDDLWNQCGIKLKFVKPSSLMDAMQKDEVKNQGQVGFQPNDVDVTKGKTSVGVTNG